MAPGICAICDTEAGVGDRVCPACGADLEALVIDLGAPDDQPPAAAGAPASMRTRRTPALVACLLLVAAAAAAAAWMLLGTDDGADDDAAAPASVARPTVTVADPIPPVGWDATAGRAAAQGDKAPTSATLGEFAPVDPAQLPDMAATHLAVAGDRRLHLLDLTSGDWSARSIQNTPSNIHGVGEGVVMTGLVGGRIAFAPTDGGTPTALGSAQNELLRIDDHGVVIRRWSASPPDIVAVAFDGERRWSYRPPPGMDAIGVADDGEVIVQAGETVLGIDPADGATRSITDGTGFGVSADLLIVWRCDAELLCRTDQVDLATSESRVLTDSPIQLQPAGEAIFRGWVRGGNGRPYAYRLVDGWLERVDLPAGNASGTAFDRSGITVSSEVARGTGSGSSRSTLVFRTDDGTVVAAIESPVQSDGAKVALVDPAVSP